MMRSLTGWQRMALVWTVIILGPAMIGVMNGTLYGVDLGITVAVWLAPIAIVWAVRWVAHGFRDQKKDGTHD